MTKDKKGANEGNVYLVTRGAKKPIILRDDGKKPSKAEIKEIEGPYSNDGKDDAAMLESMPAKVAIGDKLDALAKVLADQAARSEKLDKPKNEVTVTVKEFREEGGHTVVVLAVVIALEGDGKPTGHMKIKSTGTIEFFADGGVDSKAVFTTEVEATMKGGATVSGTIRETNIAKAE